MLPSWAWQQFRVKKHALGRKPESQLPHIRGVCLLHDGGGAWEMTMDIFMLGRKANAFDSTTISSCLSVFHWAKPEEEKAASKHSRFMIWKCISPPSATSQLHPCMTQRPCQSFHMNQVRTMCSTESTTHLRNSSESTAWNPFSWLGQNRI